MSKRVCPVDSRRNASGEEELIQSRFMSTRTLEDACGLSGSFARDEQVAFISEVC
jgi:hypothetical protein